MSWPEAVPEPCVGGLKAFFLRVLCGSAVNSSFPVNAYEILKATLSEFHAQCVSKSSVAGTPIFFLLFLSYINLLAKNGKNKGVIEGLAPAIIGTLMGSGIDAGRPATYHLT
jgi:hypothetical protein